MSMVGLWVRWPTLLEGEAIVWRRAANRTQSGRRAVGGRLFMTRGRLLFEPSRFDAAFRGQAWECWLTNISGVSNEAAGGDLLSGGLRKRLRLDLADGSAELFVVNHVHEAMEIVRRAMDEAVQRPAGP